MDQGEDTEATLAARLQHNRRQRRDNVARLCEVCGAAFYPIKHKPGRACSARCGAKLALQSSHTPEARAKRYASIRAWRAENPEAFQELESRRLAATQTLEYRLAARQRYDNMIAAGTGIGAPGSRSKSTAITRSVLRQARRELERETNFVELWTAAFNRIRAECPFVGQHGSQEHADWMREIGRAVTSDPAVRACHDEFMREAIPRLHAAAKHDRRNTMTNHPNRSRKDPSPARNPTPDEIRATREAAGLTQSQSAALLHANVRAWQKWEGGERQMHPAFWELYRIKTA
jgi:putative transcriptional regulator